MLGLRSMIPFASLQTCTAYFHGDSAYVVRLLNHISFANVFLCNCIKLNRDALSGCISAHWIPVRCTRIVVYLPTHFQLRYYD